MDNKVAEKLQGGRTETEWDALKTVGELTPDEIMARRERNFGKTTEKLGSEVPAKRHEREVQPGESKLPTALNTAEKTEALVTYAEMKRDPEWKKPKIEKFTLGEEDKIPTEMLAFQYSNDKLGAVPREKAVWSFMEYVNDAKTLDEFRAANRIAGALEARADITPEERAQIADFRENPAYKFKETGFAIEGLTKRVEQSQGELLKARQAYTEARKGGIFKRLFNRMEIRNLKKRMEWWEKRVSDEKGDLTTKKLEQSRMIQAEAGRKAEAKVA